MSKKVEINDKLTQYVEILKNIGAMKVAENRIDLQIQELKNKQNDIIEQKIQLMDNLSQDLGIGYPRTVQAIEAELRLKLGQALMVDLLQTPNEWIPEYKAE